MKFLGYIPVGVLGDVKDMELPPRNIIELLNYPLLVAFGHLVGGLWAPWQVAFSHLMWPLWPLAPGS